MIVSVYEATCVQLAETLSTGSSTISAFNVNSFPRHCRHGHLAIAQLKATGIEPMSLS